MALPPQPCRVICFGAFELDAAKGELRKAGVSLKIHPQPFRVLLLLTDQAGRVVTREDIQRSLWGDNTFVDFERGINFCINQIRAALGDDADRPRYVETLPRRGYRFIAPVSTLAASRVEEHVLERFDSIAVLPLVNATGDPETEYLSDGISESVINLLSQFPNLRVIPRTSAFRYKGREADLKAVGRDLKVRTALTGKLIQRGDRLVVQTELVDVANDAQIWGGQFNRKLEDIFEVQEELARQISENLRLRLTSEDEKRVARRRTQNKEAYQLYLKGRFYLARRTESSIKMSFGYFERAIECDPTYALAYAGLADAYVLAQIYIPISPTVALPKARAAISGALERDESLAEAAH